MSVRHYRDLLADRARVDAFQRAIADTVRPGDRVLDAGCGLGTFALFAARAGADAVLAVDRDPVLHLAKAIAQHNGLADRIDFRRGDLGDVAADLAMGRAGASFDVLVFEDFPARLLDASTVRTLRALEPLLAADARVIPAAARLWLAPVLASAESPAWPGRRHAYGIDWSPLLEYVDEQPYQVRLNPGALGAEPARLASVALRPLPDPSRLGGSAEWRLDRDAVRRLTPDIGGPPVLVGLALWFDLVPAAGLEVSNRPGPDAAAWGQLVLPVAPVPVEPGTAVRATVAPTPLADGAPGWLAWTLTAGDHVRRGHEFRAHPASLADLYGGEPSHKADTAPDVTTGGGRSDDPPPSSPSALPPAR